MPGAELRLRLQLRRKDMDVLGHLNHSVYQDFCFEARGALMDSRAEGRRFVVARTELDFLREVRHEDGHVDVLVRVVELGAKSVTLLHELLLPDGTLAARNRTVLVAWDPVGRRSRELGPDERSALLAGDARALERTAHGG